MASGFVNLRMFSLQLEEAHARSIAEITKRQRALSFKAFKSVVHTTPVDTGRLKGAWTMAINTPDDRVPPPGGAKGSYSPAVPGSLAGLKAFDVVYINNALPYAVAIEDGHGGRAPGVMVEHTINVLEQEAKITL
jgi:hypothetical protein